MQSRAYLTSRSSLDNVRYVVHSVFLKSEKGAESSATLVFQHTSPFPSRTTVSRRSPLYLHSISNAIYRFPSPPPAFLSAPPSRRSRTTFFLSFSRERNDRKSEGRGERLMRIDRTENPIYSCSCSCYARTLKRIRPKANACELADDEMYVVIIDCRR